MERDKKDFLSKIGMWIFLVFIIIFVGLSSYLYFTNSTNVAIKIQLDDVINKENTAVNEALTKTLILKNDSIIRIKTQTKKRDSVLYMKIESVEKQLKRSEYEKDSLANIISRFKQSDIQPIIRKTNN